MKIIYTDSALIELNKFQQQRKNELELYLKQQKYVFGDDVLEITASDIRDAEKHFRYTDLTKSKLPLTTLLLKLYMAVGILITLVGIFYPFIQNLFYENPKQIVLIVAGITLSLFSFVGTYYIRLREEKRGELEIRFKSYELQNTTEVDKDS